MATLKEIADLVGVSVGAVSRVLNNDTTISVGDDTKMKIFKAAEELKYKTLQQRKEKFVKAQQVVNDKVKIGIIEMYSDMQLLQDPYYLMLRNIVEKECFQKGIEVVNIYKCDEEYSFIGSKNISGIISIGKFTIEEIDMMNKITDNIVFLDSSPNELKYDSVKINFEVGIKSALNYLMNLNHKNIGYIGNLNTLDDNKKENLDIRVKLFTEYMKQNNLYNNELMIYTDEMTSMEGYKATSKFLDTYREIKPTAFIVGTDTIATGVLKALDEKGIKVPEDVSIIGFNDLITSQHTLPPLTTISAHVEYLASEAVSLIISQINERRKYNKTVIIPSELIIRESTCKVL